MVVVSTLAYTEVKPGPLTPPGEGLWELVAVKGDPVHSRFVLFWKKVRRPEEPPLGGF